jgi:hypothetical protein
MKPLRLALALFPMACTTPKLVGDGESTGEPTSGDPTATEGMTSAPDSSASDSMTSATDPSDSGTGADTGEIPNDGRYVDCADFGPDDGIVSGDDAGPLGFYPFACNPRTSGTSPTGHKCCSSDPSTADGALPVYEGRGIEGSTPLYADAANFAGTWGMCIEAGMVPEGFGLLAPEAAGCPIPCNPQWIDADVEAVCGQGRTCCQTIELRPKDCVFNEATEFWRAVRGTDIGSDEITPRTYWNATAHETHQDPNGTICLAYAAGDAESPEFAECVQHLTVADERGFCLGLSDGQGCPADAVTYVDVCEAMNG